MVMSGRDGRSRRNVHQRGQSVAEYVILVALMVTLGFWAVQTLGSQTSEAFCKVSNGFNAGGGSFYGMGRDEHGQLGNGSTGGPYSSPQKAKLCGNFLAAGRNSSAAVANDGTIYAWGISDGYGELGSSLPAGSDHSETPLPVPLPAGASGGVKQIAMGLDFSAALTGSGQIYMWGLNNYGELALGCADLNDYGPYNNNPALVHATPTLIPASDFVGTIVQISAGNQAMYARTNLGTLYAWGSNGSDQLGQGAGSGWPSIPQCGGGTNTTCGCDATPVQVALLGNSVNDITSMNSDSAYATMNDGTIEAWGADWGGQLGNNQTGWFSDPQLVGSGGCPGGVMQNIKQVRAGIYSAMALDKSGNVYTWGVNQPTIWAYGGMLGNASTNDSECPIQPNGVNGHVHLDNVAMIGAGNYGCFAEINNVMYSWGSDANSELGYNPPSAGGGGLNGNNETVPTQVTSLPNGVLQIGGGYGFTTMTYPPSLT